MEFNRGGLEVVNKSLPQPYSHLDILQQSSSPVWCLLRLPKSKPLTVDNNRGGRGRLPQRRCPPEIMLRSPQYSPLRPSQSSSEDTSSEHSSSSSYMSSPGRDRPTEIPKLCPPPYGFHFGAQKAVSIASPSKTLHTNQGSKDTLNSLLSPQHLAVNKRFLSPPPVPKRQQQEEALSPSRTLKPPPPYTRLVRTPSLKEYPNHAFRLLPREIVSEELKSWHQRNQLQKLRPSGEQQSSLSVTSPTSPRMPPFTPVSTRTNCHHYTINQSSRKRVFKGIICSRYGTFF